MAKLSEIISKMEDNVKVQYLSDSMVSIKDKKRTCDTEITFATTEVTTNSWLDDKKTALIVWVDKGEFNSVVSKLNGKDK